MKKLSFVLIGLIVAGALTISLAALSGRVKKGGAYGAALTAQAITPISAILSEPQRFVSQTVKVSGRITQECPAGGWFFLKDDTGVFYVDLHPSYFAIPQAIGHTATAEGIIQKEGVNISMLGKGVEVQ